MFLFHAQLYILQICLFTDKEIILSIKLYICGGGRSVIESVVKASKEENKVPLLNIYIIQLLKLKFVPQSLFMMACLKYKNLLYYPNNRV